MQPYNNQSSTLNTSSGGARSHRVPLQRDRLRAAVLVTFVVVALPAATAWPQDQIIKPVGALDRLPGPTPVVARQRPDGRIEVSWPAVDGAAKYELWRSVPPAGQVIVPRTNPEEIVYVDSDVKAGSTYYYLVAAVNGSGTVGLKVGATPVTATINPTFREPSAQTISAGRASPTTVAVSYTPVIGATAYRLERWMMRALANGSPDTTSTQRVTLYTSTQTSYTDNLGPSTVNQFVECHVTPMLTAGTAPTVVSGLVMIPAATTTTTSTSGGTSTTGTNSSTSAFTGSTTFTAATPAAIKTGMTASLASVAGISGARWVSLNESVATVDASGTVTGRAGGSTQVVALSAAPDGSLRVVAVPVTVTP